MISRITGEIAFSDGLHIQPHAPVPAEFLVSSEELMPGWRHHKLGLHESEHGQFEVSAVSGSACRVQMVRLSHSHPFYRPETPRDAERRAFHEGVIGADLGGQREFSWGSVHCTRDPGANRDGLFVVYAAGPQVPMSAGPLLHFLEAEEPEPREEIEPSNEPSPPP